MEPLLYLNPTLSLITFEDGVVLESADGFQITRDAGHIAAINSLRAAPRTTQQIACDTEGRLDPERMAEVIGSLEARGILEQGAGANNPSALACWRAIGADATSASIAQTTYSVAIVGDEVETTWLIPALIDWGFALSGRPKSFVVVVSSDPLSPVISATNVEAIASQSPWILVVVEGANAWLSLFQPGATACAECLTARLRHNRPARTLGEPAEKETPVLTSAMANLVARSIARTLAFGGVPELNNQWVLFDGHTGNVLKGYPVDHLPHCSACGRGLGLDADPKTLANFATLDYRRLINPVTGIARDLRFLRSIDGVSASVLRNRFTEKATSFESLMRNEQHVSGGKGWTQEEAAISACGEAVERISGCYRDDLPTLDACAEELGEHGLLPNQVDLFSEFQLSSPSAPDHLSALTIPHRMDETNPTKWVRAFSIRDGGQSLWYPAGAAFYGYPFEGVRFALASSNGCAAGPTPADAVKNGLLELIERDAAAIWWYNKIQRPALDPESFEDDRLRNVRETLKGRNRTFDLLDVTTDLGIPVVVVVSRRERGLPGWTMGFGAGFSHEEAALRATGELAQLIAPTDDMAKENLAPWVDSASIALNPHLVPSGSRLTRNDFLAPTLATLLSALEAAGLTPYAINQTHPLIGVPVVRTLVPGLVHFWRRLGAWRLYDVPVRMGWLPEARKESEMNSLDLTL